MEGDSSVFTEKLRVLVVDDDHACVKIITQMLKQCNYEVTQVSKATEALETLKQSPKSFDMVITDTCNDIDVISLIINILKMENIPVILATGSEDTATLMQGVVQGADDVLSKPISIDKIKTLWQHVYRRRLMKKDDNPGSTSSEDEDEEEAGGKESEPRRKKARVRWTGKLQEKFMDAVMQLGGPESAMPKKIMELMNDPGVSRESVASHLQKYRKQKKPIVGQKQNNSPLVWFGTNSSPNFGFAPPHHHHQYSTMGHSINACSSPTMVLPHEQLSMLPPLPTWAPPQHSLVVPISSRDPYSGNTYLPQCQAFPPPLTMAGDGNANTLSLSGNPWRDSNLLDEAFFSMYGGLNQDHDLTQPAMRLPPEVDQWPLEGYPYTGAGAGGGY